MFRKLFEKLGENAVEKELRQLIEKVQNAPASDELVFHLHAYAILTAKSWRSFLDDETATFCDELLRLADEPTSEEVRRSIAQLACVLTSAQRGKKPHQKFGIWFWRVIFLSTLRSETLSQARELTKLLSQQTTTYMAYRDKAISQYLELGHKIIGGGTEDLREYEEFKERIGVELKLLSMLESWETLPDLIPNACK